MKVRHSVTAALLALLCLAQGWLLGAPFANSMLRAAIPPLLFFAAIGLLLWLLGALNAEVSPLEALPALLVGLCFLPFSRIPFLGGVYLAEYAGSGKLALSSVGLLLFVLALYFFVRGFWGDRRRFRLRVALPLLIAIAFAFAQPLLSAELAGAVSASIRRTPWFLKALGFSLLFAPGLCLLPFLRPARADSAYLLAAGLCLSLLYVLPLFLSPPFPRLPQPLFSLLIQGFAGASPGLYLGLLLCGLRGLLFAKPAA
ncbi:MAG: hypothetical protein LBU47_06330 [Christensenellaceae bacterium]|jgi:hypothetical protein|nr:hypothetical protein [Christensenellaceae bacterium]